MKRSSFGRIGPPDTGETMRKLIRTRPNRATRILIAVAMCLLAALAIVSRVRTEAQVRGIEQFAIREPDAMPHFDPFQTFLLLTNFRFRAGK